jgi:hypothetical protein
MNRAVTVGLLIIVGSLAVEAQTSQGTRKAATKKAGPSVSQQLTELKQAVEAQQQQISTLSQQVQSRDQRIQQLEQKLDQNQATATQAQAKADTAATQATEQAQSVTTLNSKVTDLESNSTNFALSLQETQKNMQDQMQSPLALHYKGVTITPGGFLAAETVYRKRALAADINTPFNNINMPGAGQSSVSEFYGSARQSRISMLIEGHVKDYKLSGYYETDFLSAAITSNNNQSNSYSLRQRQLWGQVAAGSWSFTGGQMWSLLTETRHGMDNRSEALPMTIDPQYTIGFSWARQYGVRVVKNFGNRFWVGASLENPQTTFGAHGNAANFSLGGPGNGGGLYNSGITNCTTTTITGTGGTITNVSTSCTPAATYSFNAMPDFIVKVAAEPGFGHYEVFGILSRFRDRVYPCGEPGAATNCNGTISALGSYNNSVNAGGFGGNARFTLYKQLELGAHALVGQGVGRYGTGGLPDATVHADGTLAPLRSYQGLATVEWHTKRIDVYSNGGIEYVQRRWEYDPNNPTDPFTPVGYGSQLFNVTGCYVETPPPLTGTNGFTFGSLSKCTADTKSLVEGTFGFWVKVLNGPHGRIQFGPQYSYVSRFAWTGINGIGSSAPHGVENMFLTSFRYYLP